MKGWYMIGEPLFEPRPREEYLTIVNQVNICQKILRETQDQSTVLENLRQEYLAIVCALSEMGINFRIIYSHEDKVDKGLIALCIKYLGCKLAGIDGRCFPPSVIFPRDFATTLPRAILVNSDLFEVRVQKKRGSYNILFSPYGEGGRVLTCGRTMLVGEQLITKKGEVAKPVGLRKIAKMNIQIGLFPLPLSVKFSATEIKNKISYNDHLDRMACLIRGKDENLHLVVAPKVYTADLEGDGKCSWIPRSPEDTAKKIKSTCGPLGIKVHFPEKIEVPYSLNLIQFPDGRILMTSGDKSVEKVIREIVGEDKIFKTPIPIRFFPVWAYGGIRCLVNKAPEPLFKNLRPRSN